MTYDVVLLPGDGIGPEVVEAAVRVLDAVRESEGFEVKYTSLLAGGAAIDAHSTPLRAEDLERCRRADAILLGAVGGPDWDHLPVETRPERALLRLRSELGLGINLRPVAWTAAGGRHAPLTEDVARDTDIAFVRELTGGVYFGQPSFYDRTPGARHAVDTATYSEEQVEAVLEFAFRLARSRRGKVTSVDKANVMNTSRLWREVATDYGRRNRDVELEHALVDSFAMSLMQSPRSYDVVVTENLFGDILTDLAGVIAGSLGVLPSASLRPRSAERRFGLYEPIHGSAPSLRGQNVANPVGCILSVALMLQWSFDRPASAESIRSAVRTVMAKGRLTADLAGPGATSLGTSEFTDAVIEVLQEQGGTGGRRDLRHHVA
ncbi:MAG TPA: 3-isopropylmalate dehydrogenase [Chloroflexota bacterium]